jgi:uncharacterized protein (TIGR02217 family)
MTAFHEVRFPLEVAIKASGGPERRTDIVTLGSGREQRNARWAHSRRRYNAGYGVRSLASLASVIAFFEERRGRLHGFRFRDRLDWSSAAPDAAPAMTDQVLGSGDGTTATFALQKTYGAGVLPYHRRIHKPVAGSVLVAVDGVARPVGAALAVDAVAGTITFGPGHVPAPGAVVTAGFRFDVPVRFDSDSLNIDLEAFDAGQIPDIPLIEIVP